MLFKHNTEKDEDKACSVDVEGHHVKQANGANVGNDDNDDGEGGCRKERSVRIVRPPLTHHHQQQQHRNPTKGKADGGGGGVSRTSTPYAKPTATHHGADRGKLGAVRENTSADTAADDHKSGSGGKGKDGCEDRKICSVDATKNDDEEREDEIALTFKSALCNLRRKTTSTSQQQQQQQQHSSSAGHTRRVAQRSNSPVDIDPASKSAQYMRNQRSNLFTSPTTIPNNFLINSTSSSALSADSSSVLENSFLISSSSIASPQIAHQSTSTPSSSSSTPPSHLSNNHNNLPLNFRLSLPSSAPSPSPPPSLLLSQSSQSTNSESPKILTPSSSSNRQECIWRKNSNSSHNSSSIISSASRAFSQQQENNNNPHHHPHHSNWRVVGDGWPSRGGGQGCGKKAATGRESAALSMDAAKSERLAVVQSFRTEKPDRDSIAAICPPLIKSADPHHKQKHSHTHHHLNPDTLGQIYNTPSSITANRGEDQKISITNNSNNNNNRMSGSVRDTNGCSKNLKNALPPSSSPSLSPSNNNNNTGGCASPHMQGVVPDVLKQVMDMQVRVHKSIAKNPEMHTSYSWHGSCLNTTTATSSSSFTSSSSSSTLSPTHNFVATKSIAGASAGHRNVNNSNEDIHNTNDNNNNNNNNSALSTLTSSPSPSSSSLDRRRELVGGSGGDSSSALMVSPSTSKAIKHPHQQHQPHSGHRKIYSRKVFAGGVPWEATEASIIKAFTRAFQSSTESSDGGHYEPSPASSSSNNNNNNNKKFTYSSNGGASSSSQNDSSSALPCRVQIEYPSRPSTTTAFFNSSGQNRSSRKNNEKLISEMNNEYSMANIKSKPTKITSNYFPGYVYLIFESGDVVSTVIEKCCRQCPKTGKYFFQIEMSHSIAKKTLSHSSQPSPAANFPPTNSTPPSPPPHIYQKQVELIPFCIDDSEFISPACFQHHHLHHNPHSSSPSSSSVGSEEYSQNTAFVGALHGQLTASMLAHIMGELFGEVMKVSLDLDRWKYPIGSGKITFRTKDSLCSALQAGIIEIVTEKFKKRIQIDPYLQNSACCMCQSFSQITYFCRDKSCFAYFCKDCWFWRHNAPSGNLDSDQSLRTHIPLTR